MKKTIELERDDLNALHDVILEALNYPADKLTDEVITEYWENLPDHIKGTAIKWGCDDTVFRDKMFVWLQENLIIEQGTPVVATYGHNNVLNKPFEFLYEFGYYNTSGGCVVYIKGECNMQDSYAFKMYQIRVATPEDMKEHFWGH